MMGIKENRLVVADADWAETIPEWLKNEVGAERMVQGFKDAMNKGEESVGDAETCIYLYTLNLKQTVDYTTAQIYIYLSSKICKKRGMKLEDFMEEKLKEGLTQDEERELKTLKYELYRKRGGKVNHPLFEILKELKRKK